MRSSGYRSEDEKMMCPNCKSEMQTVTGDYHFTECGLKDVWLKEWIMVKCAGCGEVRPVLPNPDLLTKVLVEHLVREETRLDGDSIFYLRKAMGLTGTQLAEILDVQRVQVSQWENDRHPISFRADFQLRMAAAEQLLSQEHVRDVYLACMSALRRYRKDTRESRITIESHVHKELAFA